MQLSVCIIAKNEEKNIERCLKALQGYGFEIIVVDTGSEDRTREIACKYASSVYDLNWCDDFAAAKNYAIEQATNEMVMVLDSDEYLELDVERLPELFGQIERYPEQVGRIRRRNLMTVDGESAESVEWLNRIFSKKKYRYEGRIHEQIVSRSGRPYKTYESIVVIEHSGYDLSPEEKQKKAQRNIRLLERELECLQKEEKQEEIPYIVYQLGKSYYMAQQYEKACIYFEEGLSYDLDPGLEYVIDMVETYGYALLKVGRAEDAIQFEAIYKTFGNTADFRLLMGLIYMNNERFQQAIEEFERATTCKDARTKGANSYLAYYNAGVICECLGQIELAKEYYQKCGTYPRAERRLEEMVS